MTSSANTFAVAAALALTAVATLVSGTPADAKGKDFFVQEYKFNQPMHGYQGHAGNFYCSYQRLPDRKCTIGRNGNESCAIVGWTLRQSCE